eukprot:scaffold63135_cov55-Phaeocystis_antarctica.AAC.3
MRASAKPAAAPSDGAPASEDPALITTMRNKHTKPGRAMPVRAHNGCRAVPYASACPENPPQSLQ